MTRPRIFNTDRTPEQKEADAALARKRALAAQLDAEDRAREREANDNGYACGSMCGSIEFMPRLKLFNWFDVCGQPRPGNQ